MSWLAQLLEDLSWALAAIQARRHRRTLYFSKCKEFDAALRPTLTGALRRSAAVRGIISERGLGGVVSVIAYPDAFYFIEASDVARAKHILKKDSECSSEPDAVS